MWPSQNNVWYILGTTTKLEIAWLASREPFLLLLLLFTIALQTVRFYSKMNAGMYSHFKAKNYL